MGTELYGDRREAGRALAARLERFRGRRDTVVLGLPRGGVPVAWEVAVALGAPLDVMPVRKLGTPARPELAMGAVAGVDAVVVNHAVTAIYGLDDATVEAAAQAARAGLRAQEQHYRAGREPVPPAGRTAILVDDGLATGATMRAAAIAVRRAGALHVVVAVPVAAPEALEAVDDVADEVVCVAAPAAFGAVGRWYADFAPTPDAVVQALLAAPTGPRTGPRSTPDTPRS